MKALALASAIIAITQGFELLEESRTFYTWDQDESSGSFKISPSEGLYTLHDDKMTHYTMSKKLPSTFSNKDRELVLQFYYKGMREIPECASLNIELWKADKAKLKFGIEECGIR